jgi:hypothetical protein
VFPISTTIRLFMFSLATIATAFLAAVFNRDTFYPTHVGAEPLRREGSFRFSSAILKIVSLARENWLSPATLSYSKIGATLASTSAKRSAGSVSTFLPLRA